MNRVDFQQLADLRVSEAKCLLDNGFYEGAYYLIGYAVECVFKSALAKQIKQHDFPDRKLINDSYTHDLTKLLRLSGLEQIHDQEQKSNSNFAVNWAIVKDWSEEK